MGLFDHFPYTNIHEMNLDWIMQMMKALEAAWGEFVAGNSLTFADPLLHDLTSTYAKNTIVLDKNGNAYVSLKAVPVGVNLSNSEYWLMVFDYEAFLEKVNKNFTDRYYRDEPRAKAAMSAGDWLTFDDVLCKVTAAIAEDDLLEEGVNIEHFTLEDFIKAFMQSATNLIQQYKDDIDASELAYRQLLAQDIADTTASLQAQLDAAISGATVDSEVINARIGADGVTYPSLGEAIRTQFTNINNTYSRGNLFDYPAENNGKYVVYNNGTLSSLAGMVATDYISVTGGDFLYISNYSTYTGSPDSRGLAFYDTDNVFLSGIQYQNQAPMLIQVPENAAYIRISASKTATLYTEMYRFDDPYSVFISALQLENKFTFSASGTNKYVVYTNGNIGSLNGLSISDNIPVIAGSAFYICGMATSLAPIDGRGLAFYDVNDKYIGGVQYQANAPIHGIVPINAAYMIMTFATSLKYNTKLYFTLTSDSIPEIEKLIGGDILSAFTNITCIGDSLTYSQVYTGANTSRQAYETYPDVIQKKTGTNTDNVSYSGADAQYMWEHYEDQIISKPNQLFIIYLGTNDGLTNTLATDAPTSDPYNTWADTNTGCYAKLIAKCLDVGGKVILIKPWVTSGAAGVSDLPITNDVINQCASRFHCAVIEPIKFTAAKYHYWPNLGGTNSVHYNDLGYSAFACELIRKVSLLSGNNMRYIIPA